jgi:hypothetical protein
MPETISSYLIMVWFCVGFFTGAGWCLGCLIVNRTIGMLTSQVPS